MKELKTVTVANGCFWCADTVYRQLEGVENVISGYTGGKEENPSYWGVVKGQTGHAEGIQFEYDPAIISYRELLLVFFTTHDPTTLNRQAYDVGPQYRSAIFYHSEEQKKEAETVIAELNKTTFDGKIVTEVTEASTFYEAEQDHQDFYEKNPEQPYCHIIIDPKLKKLRNAFADKLKSA